MNEYIPIIDVKGLGVKVKFLGQRNKQKNKALRILRRGYLKSHKNVLRDLWYYIVAAKHYRDTPF